MNPIRRRRTRRGAPSTEGEPNRCLARPLAGAVFASLFLAAGPASAQRVQLLFAEDDEIPSLGPYVDVFDMSVNDAGEWLAIVGYFTPQNMTDRAAILNGVPILVQGDPAANTGGESVATLRASTYDNQDRLLWSIGTTGPTTQNEYLFNSFEPLGVESQPPLASGLASEYQWSSFDVLDPSHDGALVVHGVVSPIDDTGLLDVLVRQELDAGGALASETLLLFEGAEFGGQVVNQISPNRDGHDVAAAGDHWAAFLIGDGPNAANAMLAMDGEVVLREGDASPLSGYGWGDQGDAAVSVNDSGSWAVRSNVKQLSEVLDVIVRDGELLYAAGDTIAADPPATITDFGNRNSIHLSSGGDVFYTARTDSPSGDRDALIARNGRVIAQEGVTPVGGTALKQLRFGGQDKDVSPNGRFVIFRATLADDRVALLMMDLGLVEEQESCTQNLATLELVDGLPLLGAALTFELDEGQADGVAPLFVVSNAPYPTWPDCGLTTPFGELLVDVQPALGNPGIALMGPAWSAGAPSTFDVDIPADLNLLDTTYYAQGIFLDFSAQGGAARGRFSNGLLIELAPN